MPAWDILLRAREGLALKIVNALSCRGPRFLELGHPEGKMGIECLMGARDSLLVYEIGLTMRPSLWRNHFRQLRLRYGILR